MRKLLPVAMSTLVLLACNKYAEDPNAINEQDKIFLRQVYSSNKNEVETGRLTLSISNNATVKNFAQYSVNYYTTAQTDLKELLNKINYDLDTTLIALQGPLFSDLSGYTFDTAYIKSRVITHLNLLSIFQNELNEGNQTYIRYYYLNKYIDGIRANFLKADSIARSL